MRTNTNQTRPSILYISLLLGIAVLGFSFMEQRRQAQVFKQDFQHYISLTNQEARDESVREALRNLATRYPKSHILNWNYGFALGVAGRYNEAVSFYSKALDLNPFYAQNGPFLYENGLMLYKIEDYARAKVYLKAASSLDLNADQANQVRIMLQDIEKKGL